MSVARKKRMSRFFSGERFREQGGHLPSMLPVDKQGEKFRAENVRLQKEYRLNEGAHAPTRVLVAADSRRDCPRNHARRAGDRLPGIAGCCLQRSVQLSTIQFSSAQFELPTRVRAPPRELLKTLGSIHAEIRAQTAHMPSLLRYQRR